MKKSILFSVLVVGATLLQAQSITVHQTCGQNGQVLVIGTNGHEYVDLGLPSGTIWATCNVGATNPEGYGDYFAWGETAIKKGTYNWITYFDTNDGGNTFTKYNNEGGKTVLDPEDDAAHVNWGGSWRMPTPAEWQELLDNCTWTWTTQNGINGYKVTSNMEGYTDKFIFLPAAGIRYIGAHNEVGSSGNYWSSSLDGGYSDCAWYLGFESYRPYLNDGNYRNYGLFVRPVLQPSSISYSLSANDTIRIYSNGCDDYQTFIGPHGGQLTMTASSDQWSHFVRWNDGNTDNPRTITTNGNADYTAYFEAYKYSVQVQSNDAARGRGYISKVVKESTIEYNESVGTFDAGSEVFLAYQANYGYHFTKWDVEKYQEYIEYGTLHVVKFSVPETWSNPYAWIWETGGYGHWETLSYEDGMYVYRTTQNNMNIIVVPNGPDWGSGQTNDLAITESCCYTISGEYDVNNRYVTIKNYDCFSTDEQTIIDKLDTITYVDTTITTYTTNPLSLLVAQNQKAIAYFAKNIYSITKNAAHGSISGNSSAEYLDEVTLSVSSNYGYHFAQWSDGNTDNPRTIELTQDTTFTAEFAKNSYAISTISANPEWGTTAGDTTALYLDEVEISAIPNYGYHFVRWNDYNTSNPRTVSVTEDKTYTATFAKNVYSITKNAEHGTISGNSSAEYLDLVTLTVTPDYGYHFTQWSDGLKDNPRIAQITKDTAFTAEFAYDRVGTCGKDLALVWSYDPTNKVLTIGNAGSFTENMQFGLEAPNEMEELVIGNSVTAIGANAFAGIETLKKVSIGESVKTIGEQAFFNCVNLETIFNYRPTPTNAYSTAFDGVDKFECKLYVLTGSIDMYKAAAVWRDFYYTYAIGAKEATVTTNDVQVEPQDNAATVTWPTSNNAATYTIQITKDGVVFCTLIFNANGQLTGIAFAPSRDGQAHAPAATMTANGLQFTVTGLSSGTQYGYNLTAKDANDQTVATYSGEFTTTSEGEDTGVEEVSSSLPGGERGRLILHNGQIFILRGDKTYTLQGQEVK